MQSLERCGQSAGVCPRTPKLDGMIRKNTWAHRGAVAWVYLLVDVRALAAAGADGGRLNDFQRVQVHHTPSRGLS